MLQLLNCLAFCLVRNVSACVHVCACVWNVGGASSGCCSPCSTLRCCQQRGSGAGCLADLSPASGQALGRGSCGSPHTGQARVCLEEGVPGALGVCTSAVPPPHLELSVSGGVWTRDLASRDALTCSALDLKLSPEPVAALGHRSLPAPSRFPAPLQTIVTSLCTGARLSLY